MADPGQPRKQKPASEPADELRRTAEERLDGHSAAVFAAAAPADLAAAVHELRVREMELEMQNEELRRAHLEADALREKYSELFRLAPVGCLTLSGEGIVDDFNSMAARLLGAKRETLTGQPFSVFVFAPDRSVYYRHIHLLMQSGAPQSCDLRLQPVGAEPFWAHLDGRSQDAAEGEPLRYRLTLTDVHERILAEAALRESEEKYRIVADNTYDWESWTAPDGGYVYISPGCERVTGHSAAELLADPGLLPAITHPDDRERILEHLAASARDESAQHELVFRIHAPAGDERVVDHRCKPVHGADGAFLGRRASNRDITARRQAERRLKERAKELQALYGLSEIAERRGLAPDDVYQELRAYPDRDVRAGRSWTER
ncbi:MAG: PAS domain S-box protein, partial [Actinomycetes bacterium]